MVQKSGFILLDRNEIKDWLMRDNVNRVIKVIQNHHTYLPDMSHFKINNHFTLLTGMKNYHMNNNGWGDIAQNITTFPDGKIAICRDLDKAPAGLKGQNSFGICIENLGNFDKGKDAMTDAQKDAIVHVNAVLCLKFNLTPDINTVIYHHWFDLKTGKHTDGTGVTKSCPGTNFFGGNSVDSAKRNFIPLITAELQKLTKSSTIPVSGGQKKLSRAVVTATKLNVRSRPDRGSEKVGELNYGTFVDIYEKTVGWSKISTADKWVSEDYLREIKTGKVTAKTSLNVRTGPSQGARVIEKLTKGTEVTIYDTDNGWYKIGMNDKWVSADYIELDS
ncbi:MAG TPA: SH3 domain-containing protein [bacterium]